MNRIQLFLVFLLFTTLSAKSNLLEKNTSSMLRLPEKVVEVTGVEAVSLSDVYEALSADYPSFFQFWKDDTPKIKIKLIPTIEASLQAFYDAEGYYDANFTVMDTPDHVSIVIEEGEPVRVNNINISSNYDISEMITFKKGEVFKAKHSLWSKAELSRRC